MPDGVVNTGALRTYEEVASILTARGEPIGRGGVFMAEVRALRKFKEDPVLREMFEQLSITDPRDGLVLNNVIRALDGEVISDSHS